MLNNIDNTAVNPHATSLKLALLTRSILLTILLSISLLSTYLSAYEQGESVWFYSVISGFCPSKWIIVQKVAYLLFWRLELLLE